MSNPIKTIIIFLASFGLNVLAWYIPRLLAGKDIPSDLRIILFVLFFLFPLVAVLTGIITQLYVKKLWIAPLITAAASLIPVYGTIVYVPIYALFALLGSLLTFGFQKFIQKQP